MTGGGGGEEDGNDSGGAGGEEHCEVVDEIEGRGEGVTMDAEMGGTMGG